MTKDETKKILTVISATYPTFKVADPVSTLEAWHWALEEYPYGAINNALKTYIKIDGSNFAPSASRLIALLDIVAEHTLPTENEAWTMVRQACQSLDWDNPDKEFNKLPDVVRQAVGRPENLKEWAMSDIDDFESVIGSNFMRIYRGVTVRYMDERKMPQEVRQKIENIRNKPLSIEETEKGEANGNTDNQR